MSTNDDQLTEWYRDRIGEPTNDGEVTGYWVFALGVVAGTLGVLLSLVAAPATGLRELAIFLGAGGLVLILAGPTIRLPLRRTATLLAYAGVVISALALVWFLLVFPNSWSTATGNRGVIGLYGLGIIVIAVGGVLVPIFTANTETATSAPEEQPESATAEPSEVDSELDDLRAALADTEADEADLAAEVGTLREQLLDSEADEADLVETVGALRADLGVVERERAEESERLAAELRELRAALADSEADERDLAAVIARLHSELDVTAAQREAESEELAAVRAAFADAEADEADLAAELLALHESQGRFELYRDDADEYRWRLRHRNGNVLAESDQGFGRRHGTHRAMQSVRRNALGATVLDLDDEADLPAADEEFEPVEETESQASVELYEDEGGEFRWRLVHRNGNILADSGEGYSTKSNARRALRSVQSNVGPADYLWFDPAGFETYRDTGGAYRWRLVARNGQIVATSGEGYATHGNARRAVRRLRENLDSFESEVYEDERGEYRWRLRASNDELVAGAGEGYTDRSGAEDALERVQELTPEADTLDVGLAAFEIYEDKSGEHRWRLRHRNGNILADSGEGYTDRSSARDAIESVKRNMPTAATE